MTITPLVHRILQWPPVSRQPFIVLWVNHLSCDDSITAIISVLKIELRFNQVRIYRISIKQDQINKIKPDLLKYFTLILY